MRRRPVLSFRGWIGSASFALHAVSLSPRGPAIGCMMRGRVPRHHVVLESCRAAMKTAPFFSTCDDSLISRGACPPSGEQCAGDDVFAFGYITTSVQTVKFDGKRNKWNHGSGDSFRLSVRLTHLRVRSFRHRSPRWVVADDTSSTFGGER